MSIRPYVLSTIFVLTAACGSKTLYQNYSAVAPEAAPDSAYACVGKELEKLGFKRTSYDVESMRITARRTSTSPRQSNALARGWYDQLDVQLAASPTGGTEMQVKASSYMVTNTQRGPTTDETPVYAEAQAAADALINACGGSTKPATKG